MKRLLLLFLLLGFTSSSWADTPIMIEDSVSVSDTDFDDLGGTFEVICSSNDYGKTKGEKKSDECKKQSIKEVQKKKYGWGQKPTSIKKKPLNFKRK